MAPSDVSALIGPAVAKIQSTHVEPKDDMLAERARSNLAVEQLSYLLNGGKESLEKRRKFAEALSQTSWGDKTHRYSLSREEEYVGALKGALGIWSKMKKEKLSVEDGAMMRTLLDFPGGLELHIGMFIPSIMSQGTPDQQAHWLPLCFSLSVIGTYAQTELGHGTFVRGLETVAVYDPTNEQFVLHSPTLSATKWWPGGMGKTATHAVVMARLFIAAKDYGPHAFIVQLRSLETHLPIPGVKVGDIGPKFGYGGVDNGFMSLDHVCIPRDQMLMRYATVTKEGRYIPPPASNAKASYATMVYVRSDIVRGAGGQLAKAVTIATRYAAVRRQTAAAAGERELQVLDYQNVSHTLLPLVSAAYALHFTAESMVAMYKGFEADREKGDFSALPELHALSSGLKALCTGITADGIEACRRTCGGHGYSALSGLPGLFRNYVQNVTWEGDNNVLFLQVARHLIKSAAAGAHKGSAAYLSVRTPTPATSAVRGPACWDVPANQLDALRRRAAVLLEQAVHSVTAADGKIKFEGAVWNGSSVSLIRLAQAHCTQVTVDNFHRSLDALAGAAASPLPGPTVAVLRQLASLYATTALEANLSEVLSAGFISAAQAGALRARQRALLSELRPHAVPLVDAFALEDYSLNSALGREDGDVYRALLAMAQGSPLNATEEGPAWEHVLKPVMLPSGGKTAVRASRL
ncbi:MAG: hypothetical protein WDW38_005483 [Sanguina aurantia]